MRIVRAASVTALAVVPILLSVTTASAQPGDQDQPTAASADELSRFTFPELGLGQSTTVDLTGPRTRVTVPSPAGAVPSTLNAVLTTPAWLDRGWVDVESDGRPITRIALDGAAPTTPVSIPLAATRTVDGVIPLDLIPSVIPDDRYCPDPDSDAVRLIDATVDYSGAPAVPGTIADFLPVLLRKLTLFVPATPDRETITAATTVATSVVHHYGAQPVQVEVRPDSELQGAVPDGSFERSIVLTKNSDAGAELIYPVEQAPPRLYLAGTGSDLTDQARLITSDLSQIAIGTSALAGPGAPQARLAPDSITLDDLGIGAVSGTGGSTATASVDIDQTRLGRSAGSVSVHLIGSYTPGAGSVRASVDGSPLEVWEADDTGRLDRWIDIPDTALSRVGTLDVSVDHPSASSGSSCAAAAETTVTVASSTLVRSTDSSSPVPLGWRSMPQALMPQFDIALADESYAGVVRAVTLAIGLQRLSSLPLDPEVVSMEQALDGSAPAVVISPVAELPDSVTLPLSSVDETTFRITDPEAAGGATELTVDIAEPLATMQVTSVRSNAVLVASWNSAPDELDGMLSWLDADPARWFALNGDILFAAQNTEPMSLSSSALSGADAAAAATDDGTSDRMVVVVVGVGLAVLAVGGVAAFVFAVRSRRSARDPGRDSGSQ
ncbi:membrane protein [Rhodococcus sp. NKCM2511]|nr:membrane protein [Rhodococcus sp. NKCM2511]